MHWIIGDVHGMLRALQGLIKQVERDDADAEFLFVGDYVNRGPDACGVIDLLLSIRNGRYIRGNHDDMLDMILSGTSYADNEATGKPGLAVRWFLDYGLADTMASYGMTADAIDKVKRDPNDGVKRIQAAVPQRHKAFLHALGPVIEEETFFIVHAYWPPKDPNPQLPLSLRLNGSARNRRNVVWMRFAETEIMADKTWPRTGYFGHTPTPFYENLLQQPFFPVRGPKTVLLDTAAATDPRGRLTAFCHEEQRFIQVDREGKLVENG